MAAHRSVTGWLENSYTAKIANLSELPQTYSLRLEGPESARLLKPVQVELNSGERAARPVVVEINPEFITESNTDITFYLESSTDPFLSIMIESRFVGPAPR